MRSSCLRQQRLSSCVSWVEEHSTLSRDRTYVCSATGSVSQSNTKTVLLFLNSAHALWKVLGYDCRILSHKEEVYSFWNKSKCTYDSFWPYSTLHDPSEVENVYFFLNRMTFILMKDGSTKIQLRLCLGQPQSDLCPHCGKSSSIELSIILDMILNIWNPFTI